MSVMNMNLIVNLREAVSVSLCGSISEIVKFSKPAFLWEYKYKNDWVRAWV